MALNAVVKFYDALKSAGIKPEAHIFSTGGHGFGMRKQGASFNEAFEVSWPPEPTLL